MRQIRPVTLASRRPLRSPSVHLNLNVRGLSPSATLEINERSAELLAQGKDVIRLGLGQSPFPVPEVVVETLRQNAHQKDYLPVRGLRALRDAVAAYHCRGSKLERTGDDVLVGPGSKELMFLVQLVYYGDLCIPTPSWVSYEPQAHIIGRQVRWLQTSSKNNWGLQPGELEALCREDPDRPRLLILNYPNNPTGYTYGEAKLIELARVARKYHVVLLSDEIYGELQHDGDHHSIAEYYPEGTILSSGLSKWCGAGGWRLGTFTFPPELRWLLDAMAVVASETFTATSAPIQFAAVRAFTGGKEIDEYLETCRRVLAVIGRYCANHLRDSGLRLGEPDGGFYLFPDFSAYRKELKLRGVRTSKELCQKLLDDTGVAALPGESFGRPPAELTMRMAYVDFDGAAALEAARKAQGRLGDDFVREHCGKLATAVDRIGEWVRVARAQQTG